MARSVKDSSGVYFVPAFQGKQFRRAIMYLIEQDTPLFNCHANLGLYAPYWDPNASGMLIGLTQFTRKAHLIRATLEAIAYQTVDILSLVSTSKLFVACR